MVQSAQDALIEHTVSIEHFFWVPEDNDMDDTCYWEAWVTIDNREETKSHAKATMSENDYYRALRQLDDTGQRAFHDRKTEEVSMQAFASAARNANLQVGTTLLNTLNGSIYRLLSLDAPNFIAEDATMASQAILLIIDEKPLSREQIKKVLDERRRRLGQQRGEYED